MTCEACKRRRQALLKAGTLGEVVRLVASRKFWFNSVPYETGDEVTVTEQAARHLKALGHARDETSD